jgi:alkylhydroperoxidase/carboxymuconolactone decarboxylase family protein YurZ
MNISLLSNPFGATKEDIFEQMVRLAIHDGAPQSKRILDELIKEAESL